MPFSSSSLYFLFLLTLLDFTALSVAIFGPIATNAPSPAGGTVTSDQPPNSFFQGFQPPFPTNDWWVGYAAGNGQAVCAGPFPFESSLGAAVINFGISTTRIFDGTSIKQPTQTDWSVGFSEHSGSASDHKALSWDSQSVTLQYFTGSSTLTSYMIPGSPYLTFEFANATPVFTSGQGPITSFAGITLDNDGNVTASGNHFLVVNNIGTYVIYSLRESVTLVASSGSIEASSPFTGVIRVAKVEAAAHQSLLDTYSAVYPTSVTTDYTFSGDTSELIFTWNVEGGNPSDLLMVTWPHHRIKMQAPNFPDTSSLSYLTTKGYMYPALGNMWKLQYDLPTITFNAPRNPDNSCVSALIAGLEYEVENLPVVTAPGDFYWFGSHVGMVSRLALISEIVGRQDLVDIVVEYLKAMYAFWFNASSTTLPAYESAWGGIIDKAGYNNVYVDYGNGYYNDHHFHYGYFLAAAAVIAKYDSTWLNTHKDSINEFVRDITNPSIRDPYFPVVRCRDWFAGHSWASGIANNAGSRDQESLGEAVNGYYGALLWADITGNTDMKNFARLLVATEQHAGQTYWHMYPSSSSIARDQPYPEQALRDLVTIGNVEDWQSGAWLFWGDQWKIQVPAIQILPVTPINEYLYDTSWVQAMFNSSLSTLQDPNSGDEWKSVIYLAYSQVNPVDAAARSSSLTTWGTGNSYSNQLYFISTRPGASGVCTSFPANPQGNFVIQSASTRLFVSDTKMPNLVAAETEQANAAVFSFGFAPNAGTIQAVGTQQYVTADQTGGFTISASRAIASAWEIFVVRQKIGAAANVYSIMAASNKEYFTVQGDGSLINNGPLEVNSSGFILVPV